MTFRRPALLLDRTLRVRVVGAVLGLALTLSAGASDKPVPSSTARLLDTATPTEEKTHVWISIGNVRFDVTLEDNPTAAAFAKLLPATFDMTELNGNEKYVRLPSNLPNNPTPAGTIRAGDILLYGNSTVVVFYETFQSSYSYTRIGRVAKAEGLAKALGRGNPRITFSLP